METCATMDKLEWTEQITNVEERVTSTLHLDLVQVFHGIPKVVEVVQEINRKHIIQSVCPWDVRSFLPVRNAGHHAVPTAALWLLYVHVGHVISHCQTFRDPSENTV